MDGWKKFAMYELIWSWWNFSGSSVLAVALEKTKLDTALLIHSGQRPQLPAVCWKFKQFRLELSSGCRVDFYASNCFIQPGVKLILNYTGITREEHLTLLEQHCKWKLVEYITRKNCQPFLTKFPVDNYFVFKETDVREIRKVGCWIYKTDPWVFFATPQMWFRILSYPLQCRSIRHSKSPLEDSWLTVTFPERRFRLKSLVNYLPLHSHPQVLLPVLFHPFSHYFFTLLERKFQGVARVKKLFNCWHRDKFPRRNNRKSVVKRTTGQKGRSCRFQ